MINYLPNLHKTKEIQVESSKSSKSIKLKVNTDNLVYILKNIIILTKELNI